MPSFFLSPEAHQDLFEIRQYIAEDNSERALTILDEIEEKCQMLSEYPNIGHHRPDLTSHPILFWPIYTYLIVYKKHSNPLEIVRILSSYRNLINLLS